MAVSIVLTGTGQNCTLTSGSNSIVVTSATGLVIGATIQGTGIPTGSRIGSISGTTVTMVTAAGAVSNATVGGTQSLIFSSVYGSTLTITMSGATDYATPQDIYNAGFGVMETNTAKREIFFPGGLTVYWGSIVAGAVFDFLNWSLEFGVGGRWQFEGAVILGELRGGYLVNGTQFMKTAGPTFYSNSWNNGGAGGSNMWTGTATGTMTGKFRMHNVRFVEYAGSNASFYFAAGRMEMIVENMILDHQGDSAGANASIGAAFGTLKNTYIVKANSGISATNGTNFATFDGLYYVGNYQSTPQHKFSMPNGFTLDGYQPQVTSSQFVGGFANGTTETYSNINLTTAGWGLNDLKTKYLRYGGTNVLNFPRTVAFEFNDSSAANLSNVTLYIKSGSTSLVNAVQTGDYNAYTQALILNWTTTTTSYRVCDSFVDTIAQTAQFRKNGYISQSVSYSLDTASYSQPVFMLTDPAYGSVTPTAAAALTGLSLDYTNKVYTISTAHNLDEVYAFGQYSQALTANSAQADFQASSGGKYSLTSPWKMNITGGATTMGTYNNTFNSSTSWTFGGTSSLNLNKDDVVWTPAVRADLFQFQSGSTFNITNGSTLTVSPTAGLGYGSATTSEFRSGSTLNMSDSTVTYNVVSGGSGTVFSNTEAGATWNISNSTLTLNCPNGAQVAIHAYFLPTSVINNFTVNGTASNVIWQMGYTSNNSKMVGFKYGGAIFGNGTSNILMDTYTYTGSLTSINNTFGSANKWWWVDPTMQAGGLFRWAAGSTPTGSSGFYGVIGFRPTFTIDKTGYAPKMRVKPSAMATRYPTQIFNTTALSTVARSNFFRDPTFMDSSDGFLPFLDSLDSKTVLNTIDWEVQVRQAGWQDLTQTFTAATAKTGLITAAFAGVSDAYYVNATTALADSALISVDTGTKTISSVSGSLTWSPQRLYNALKNWWATYASDTDFLSTTSGSTLKLGDYNVASNISFVEGNSNDVLTAISTTGLINAATNEIPITDSRGTSTIWQFENISVGSSIIVYDASGVTKYFQQEVTTAGNYIYYIPPGTTGTYTWAIELYGKQRQSGSFAANTGGLLFYEPIYVEDVGISQTTKATVAAYTAIDNLDKFYDFTAYRRLSEDFIKIGQIATRSGTSVEIGNYNLTVNAAASVIESITGSTITIKSGTLAAGSKYTTIIATPPKLVTAATTEIITAAIEDGNGDSSVTIQGGSGDFTLWKLANLVPDDDYATGVNLGDVGNVTYRFLHADGYKIIIRDNSTAYRISCPMEKGVYTRGLFFGDQVQLAQSAEVTQINTKVDILTNDVAAVQTSVDGLPTTIMNTTVETGATVVESLRLHNSILGGKVSGAGSGTETFRDLADTKDRVISTVDSSGNRIAEIDDLT